MSAPYEIPQEFRPSGVVIVRDRSALPVQQIAHDSEGVTKQVLLGYNDSTGYLTQESVATYEPGGWFASHVHDDMDESFEVQSGVLTLTFGEDDEVLTLEAGGYAYFPAGVCHGGRSVHGAVVKTVGVRMRVSRDDADAGKGKNIPSA